MLRRPRLKTPDHFRRQWRMYAVIVGGLVLGYALGSGDIRWPKRDATPPAAKHMGVVEPEPQQEEKIKVVVVQPRVINVKPIPLEKAAAEKNKPEPEVFVSRDAEVRLDAPQPVVPPIAQPPKRQLYAPVAKPAHTPRSRKPAKVNMDFTCR